MNVFSVLIYHQKFIELVSSQSPQKQTLVNSNLDSWGSTEDLNFNDKKINSSSEV